MKPTNELKNTKQTDAAPDQVDSFGPMKLDDGSTSTPESRTEYRSTLLSLMSDLWDEDLKAAEKEWEAEHPDRSPPWSKT